MLRAVRSLTKDVSLYGLSTLLTKFGTFLLIPIYTRLLSTAGYGVLSLATLTGTLLIMVLPLGQDSALVLLCAKGTKEESLKVSKELLPSVFLFTMAFAIVVTVLGFVFGPHFFPKGSTESGFSFYPYAALVLVTATVGIPLLLVQSINRAQRAVNRFAVIQLAVFLISTCVGVYLVAIVGRGARGALEGSLVGAVACLPVAIFLMTRMMKPVVSWQRLKQSLRIGIPLAPHSLAGWILGFADRVMLEHYSGATQVGLYSAAYNLALGMTALVMTINQAWSPFYFQTAQSDQRPLLKRLSTIVAIVYTVLGLGFVLFSKELLVLMSGAHYREAGNLVPIIAAGCYGYGLYCLFSTSLFFSLKTKLILSVSASAAILNIALNILLIPRYGMVAAAWATLVAYAMMAGIVWVVASRGDGGLYEHRKVLRLVVMFCVVFGITLFVDRSGLSTVLALSIKGALFVLVFPALAALKIVTFGQMKQQLAALRSTARS